MNQLSLMDMPAVKPHPAKYTPSLLPVMADMLKDATRILDPFAGTGRIFQLRKFGVDAGISAIELEPEWANCHPETRQGNALHLPFEDDYFDAICTSPTYGNRMADCHTAQDDSRRNTYTHIIGRQLHPDNSGTLQWGEKYREFHVKAWEEATRVLVPGGLFVFNIKDHIRGGVIQQVTEWHIDTLEGLGLSGIRHERVACPGNRQGANGELILDYESVILMRMK